MRDYVPQEPNQPYPKFALAVTRRVRLRLCNNLELRNTSPILYFTLSIQSCIDHICECDYERFRCDNLVDYSQEAQDTLGYIKGNPTKQEQVSIAFKRSECFIFVLDWYLVMVRF